MLQSEMGADYGLIAMVTCLDQMLPLEKLGSGYGLIATLTCVEPNVALRRRYRLWLDCHGNMFRTK